MFKFYTLNEMDLVVIRGSYSPPHVSPTLNEIELIGDPELKDQPASIIQQGGRTRKKCDLTAWLTLEEYKTIQDLAINGEVVPFKDIYNNEMNVVVVDVEPQRDISTKEYIIGKITMIEG